MSKLKTLSLEFNITEEEAAEIAAAFVLNHMTEHDHYTLCSKCGKKNFLDALLEYDDPRLESICCDHCGGEIFED